jgi:hypothetical protein
MIDTTTAPKRMANQAPALPEHPHSKSILKHLGSVMFDLTPLTVCEPGDGEVPPMKSVLLKYEKLEYFSRSQ